jgi:hypothetical protein
MPASDANSFPASVRILASGKTNITTTIAAAAAKAVTASMRKIDFQ